MATSAQDSPTTLSVTSLSQYVRLENCDRYLWLRLRPDQERQLLQRWGLTIQPLTPLLKESGANFEHEVTSRLAVADETIVNLEGEPLKATLHWLRRARQPTILLQPALEAPLGQYQLRGRADVIRLDPDRRGLRVLVADIKASRQTRMEYRLQVAAYCRMLLTLAAAEDLPIKEARGTVIHLTPDGAVPPLSSETESFDLAPHFAILERLVSAEDSTLNRISS